MATKEEQKLYELRLTIEASMYESLDNGFDIDDLENFVADIVEKIKDEEEE